MEGMVVNAVFTLQDLLSGGLGRIRKLLGATDGSVAGLSTRMGRLALAMAPLAALSATLMFGFGVCTAKAMEFEKAISGVGAVARATPSELAELEKTARDLGASTAWSAVQVAEAEKYLAMAGFSVAENIAALPGVLNMASAAQMDLGRASDISSDILSAFKLKTSDMDMVADTLTRTFTTCNTSLELLGESMKYVAPVAAQAGMSLQETAAMTGMLANIGIKGSQGGTTLRTMLARLAAPAGRAGKALQSLGVNARDAAGNLRNPLEVLGEISGAMEAKNLGTGEQLEILKKIFGEEAMAGAAELVAQEGARGITKYLDVVKDYSGAAAEVASRQLDNLAGDITKSQSAWEGLSITIGKVFTPMLRPLVQWFGELLGGFDSFMQSPVGAFILRLTAALASGAIGITLFAGAVWGIGALMPIIGNGFVALKGAVLGLGWPFLLLAAVFGTLYLAYKNNFGGFADFVDRSCKKVTRVISGVVAVFESLTGGVGEIRGELAEDIEALGLVGVVTTLSRLIRRFSEVWSGAWSSVSAHFKVVQAKVGGLLERLGAVFGRVGNAVGKLIDKLFGNAAITGGVGKWQRVGEAIGAVINWLVDVAVFVVERFVVSLELIVDAVDLICAIFSGDFKAAGEIAAGMLDKICGLFSSLLDVLPFDLGKYIRDIFNGVTEFFDNFSLFESGKKIIGTMVDGIVSMKDALVETVSGVFDSVRQYLPFSDAKKGPFSDLTASGAAILGTLGQGVTSSAGSFVNGISGVFGQVANLFGFAGDLPAVAATLAITDGNGLPNLPNLPNLSGSAAVAQVSPSATPATLEGRALGNGKQSERAIIIQNLHLTLPDVDDAPGFLDGLKRLVEQFDAEEYA